MASSLVAEKQPRDVRKHIFPRKMAVTKSRRQHRLADFSLRAGFIISFLWSRRQDRDVKLVSAAERSERSWRDVRYTGGARSGRTTIYHRWSRTRTRTEKRILRLPLRRFVVPVPGQRKRATRIDPSVARDELPANAPPKQISACEKETFQPSRVDVLKRSARTCPPAARYSRRSIPASTIYHPAFHLIPQAFASCSAFLR